MLASTESLLNKAMDLNTEIQDDNLHMLEMKSTLKSRAAKVDAYKRIKNSIQKNDIDKVTFKFLDMTVDFSNTLGVTAKDVLDMSADNRKAILSSKIDRFIGNEKLSISNALVNMLEISLKDIDEKTEFKNVTKLPKKKAVIYNYHACENLKDTFTNILQTLSFTANARMNYRAFKSYLVDKLENDMAMVHTKISNEGYVTIDVPCPSVQDINSSEWSCESINKMSNDLNKISYKEMKGRLANIKLGMINRINNSSRVEDDVCYMHLLAQMIMSVKNSIMLVKNYHTAAINEITC